MTLSAELQAATTATADAAATSNLGNQLLAQLQDQAIGRKASLTGINIGQQLLSQLQGQSNSSTTAGTNPNVGQQLLMQLQGQADARAPAGTNSGQAFLQQLQAEGTSSSPIKPPQVTPSTSVAQTDAGRVLLAQLQRSPVKSQQASGSTAQSHAQRVAQSTAQPAHQSYQGPATNSVSVSFEQLLRGAASSQRSTAQPMAQPAAKPAAQVANQHPVAGAAAPSFDQMLRAAAAQQQPPAPPPRFARAHQSDPMMSAGSASGQAQLPGLGFSQQRPGQAPPVPAAMTDPGKLLLQQLHAGGLQGSAPKQQLQGPQGQPVSPVSQPSHASGNVEAGRMLLQQLQNARISDTIRSGASGAAAVQSGPSALVGAAVDAPQPVPSAPPAPASVLLQNAAGMSGISTDVDCYLCFCQLMQPW